MNVARTSKVENHHENNTTVIAVGRIHQYMDTLVGDILSLVPKHFPWNLLLMVLVVTLVTRSWLL